MQEFETLKIEKTDEAVSVILNRPEKRNAFNEVMITELTACFKALGTDDSVSVIFLQGAGDVFCAGADLGWMRRMADFTYEANIKDSRSLSDMLVAIDLCPKPTIALVQGAAYGGGVGLVAACDMAFVTAQAKFCLSEVKMGLIPATISPYVVRAMGKRQARRYMLSAEIFDAEQAQKIGFIHEICSDLTAHKQKMIEQMSGNAMQALAQTKNLLQAIENQPINDDVRDLAIRMIAQARTTDEAKSRIKNFLRGSDA